MILISSLSALGSQVNAETHTKNHNDISDSKKPDEETLVMGRKGDFTVITEDTQKLIDTAGSLGDPLGAVFSLPGVVASGGDGGEPAVRGSSPEDNIYVVDFMPTSYIFHEFGVSVFSEFIIQDFQMYSAGFGPEFSGVTGAAFDVTLRQPKKQPIGAIVDLSMLRSGLFLEGALSKDSAFFLSTRVSLIDQFVSNDDASDEDEGIIVQQIPRDFDYQFKYSWDINSHHRINLSANGAGDEAAAELTEQASFIAGNPDFAGDAELENRYDGQNIVWEYSGDKHDEFKLGVGKLVDESNLYWGDDFFNEITLEQTNVKTQYKTPLGDHHLITIGAQHSRFNFEYRLDQILFICTEFDANCDLFRRERIQVEEIFEYTERTIYFNETWMPISRFTLDLGLQVQENDFNKDRFYHPRIATRFDVDADWAITAKAGRYNRFPSLETILPEIGNPNLSSPTAEHYTIGVIHEISNGWSWSLEGYYKELENLPLALDETDENADLFYTNGTEGRAFGADLLINKDKTDKWYSWLALSIGKSERTNLRTGETKDYRLDTPLIFNWVYNYQVTSNFNFGWRWTIRSGAASTPIVGVQESPFFEDTILPVYGEPFSENLPTYNRLDIRFKWDFKTFSQDSALILDIINATNNENVLERNLDRDRTQSVDDEVAIEEEVGIGFQPAITYRIRF